jgi:hypothetical protein
MIKKVLCLALASVLLQTLVSTQTATARSRTDREEQIHKAERVKAAILKLGTGRETRIKVKLLDRRQVEGYVSEIREDSFTISDLKTESPTVVAYPQVGKVQGHHLRGKTIVWIAMAALFVIAVIVGRTVDD